MISTGNSSSKSSVKSESSDNRSVASGFKAIAAGGNKGIVSGEKNYNFGGGGSSVWKIALIVGVVGVGFYLLKKRSGR